LYKSLRTLSFLILNVECFTKELSSVSKLGLLFVVVKVSQRNRENEIFIE